MFIGRWWDLLIIPAGRKLFSCHNIILQGLHRNHYETQGQKMCGKMHFFRTNQKIPHGSCLFNALSNSVKGLKFAEKPRYYIATVKYVWWWPPVAVNKLLRLIKHMTDKSKTQPIYFGGNVWWTKFGLKIFWAYFQSSQSFNSFLSCFSCW